MDAQWLSPDDRRTEGDPDRSFEELRYQEVPQRRLENRRRRQAGPRYHRTRPDEGSVRGHAEAWRVVRRWRGEAEASGESWAHLSRCQDLPDPLGEPGTDSAFVEGED